MTAFNPITILLIALALPTVLAIAGGFVLTVWRRALGMRPRRNLLFAASNEADFRGDSLTMPGAVGANNGVGPISGDLLVYGQGTSPSFGLVGVAETSYTQPSGLVPTGNISVKFVGVFFLAVQGKSSIGGSGKTINPGDIVYADGGTYDAATNSIYGCTLNANTSGVKVGVVLDQVLSGQTTTVRVKLKQAAG